MEFDEVLRYVSFGRIKFDEEPTEESKPDRSSGRGRHDLTFVFNWLKDKHVKYIVKVAVDDRRDPPHCDSAIESCLSRLSIETLAWSKTDLCSETIWEARKDLKELRLNWSGNRGALQAWSEPDGLLRLPGLERVKLAYDPRDV
jgi:hypothetical protein